MNYQRQTSNGKTIEQINGKFYINGVEAETGKLGIQYSLIIFLIAIVSFIAGMFFGLGL